MARTASIAQRFRAQATATPDQPALIFPEVTFSYRQLQSLVAAFALRFRAAKIGANGIMRIESLDPAVSVPAMLAASLLGVQLDLAGENPMAVVITTGAPATTGPHLIVDQSFSPALFDPRDREAIWDEPMTDTDLPWLQCAPTVQSDGGRFALSQGDVTGRLQLQTQTLLGTGSRLAVLFPPTGYAGLTYRLAALVSGAGLIESGAWETLRAETAAAVVLPASGLREMAGVAVGGPIAAHCTALGLRLRDDDLATALNLFQEVSLVPDLVETGPVLATVYRSNGSAVDTQQTLFLKAEVVDLSGNPARIGRLRLKRKGPEQSWVVPGIAARQDEAKLDLLGPATGQETIRVAGQVLDAELIDAVISSTQGIVDAVAFASPKVDADELIVFAIFQDGVNRYQVVQRVEGACRDAFGSHAVPAKIRPISAIPRMIDGRPDRTACQEMILTAAGQVA